MYEPHAKGDQKEALDLLHLESKMVVSHYMSSWN